MDETFLCKCIVDTLDGLRDGLAHFSGPSRAAVIFALDPDDPMRVFDPQQLLKGHEPRFRELYIDTENWRRHSAIRTGGCGPGEMTPMDNLGLAGLISCGGLSKTVFYQMWFTEHHPDMCSVGPTECWLEHAAWRFSHDMAGERNLYTGISGYFLREYAMHAVRDHIVDELNRLLGMDTRIRVYPILDAILGISRTREERAWPRGELVFIDPGRMGDIRFLAKFPARERPGLSNFKHVRKLLLAVENSPRKLVSDGSSIVGISGNDIPGYAIVADFRGGHGFVRLQDRLVCSFSDGRFKSTTHRAKLVQVEEALLEVDLGNENGGYLYRIITELVHHAETAKHGCTVVIDLNDTPVEISGQTLTRPLDLEDPDSLALAKSLTAVDGALHVGRGRKLHGFACLLHGRSVPGEDRSRGARYNSALRFTAEHAGIIVVVVSADRGVSVIQDGGEINAQCGWKPLGSCIPLPPTVAGWVAGEYDST